MNFEKERLDVIKVEHNWLAFSISHRILYI
jgi:hypothetical protein